MYAKYGECQLLSRDKKDLTDTRLVKRTYGTCQVRLHASNSILAVVTDRQIDKLNVYQQYVGVCGESYIYHFSIL